MIHAAPVALALSILAGEPTTTVLGTDPGECTLDVHALEGMWVMRKAAPDVGASLDTDFGIGFWADADGVRGATATGGRVFPQLPLTSKFDYRLKEVVETANGSYEALYVADLTALYPWDEGELETKKEENLDLGWMAELMLYVRVDERRLRSSTDAPSA